MMCLMLSRISNLIESICNLNELNLKSAIVIRSVNFELIMRVSCARGPLTDGKRCWVQVGEKSNNT